MQHLHYTSTHSVTDTQYGDVPYPKLQGYEDNMRVHASERENRERSLHIIIQPLPFRRVNLHARGRTHKHDITCALATVRVFHYSNSPSQSIPFSCRYTYTASDNVLDQ